ncbi:hypothetical protein [Caballeronia sp. S22]|uniref:hypothetical protein n=1 Tax=Caballeronia sp. S22 TaxID=3137182 RepID=UPI003530BB9F
MMKPAEIVQEILKEVREPEDVERTWTASWLLSPIHSNRWVLRLDGSVNIDGQWKNVLVVNWTDSLPDGTRLDDDVNRIYLELIQKAAYLIREESCDIRSSNSFLLYIAILKGLTQWIFSNSKRFHPATAGLSLVGSRATREFVRKYLSGGMFEAGGYAYRFLKAVDPVGYQNWRDSSRRQSVFNLPPSIVTSVSQWLSKSGFYRLTSGIGPTRGLRYVSRGDVSAFLQADLTIFRGEKSTVFLRQFEPDYIAQFPGLSVRASSMNRQCISQRTRMIDEVIASKANSAQTTHTISVINALQQINVVLPLSLPTLPNVAGKSPLGSFLQDAGSSSRTPWIPLEISHRYLKESLRWVLRYGGPLVCFFIGANLYFKKRGWLISFPSGLAATARKSREEWTLRNLPKELEPLGLSGWARCTRNKEEDENVFSVAQAMTVLVGACTYLISNLAPSRIDEVLSLEKQCLSFKNGDGFWLDKRRGKHVESDKHGTSNIPVPRSLALAIDLLVRIGLKAKEFSARYHQALAKYLFYLPQFHDLTTMPMELKNKKSLCYAIDVFCDFVGLDPDQYGRRWYPRVHENRKSFLLTFVWSFKYAALDAARMLAGHTDINHILAYIKANFSGEEISELEADYLAQALWNFGVSRKHDKEVRNLDSLYTRVCSHFRVREISEVAHEDLKDWLELCLSEGSYVIDVIDVVTRFNRHRIALILRFRKVQRSFSH